MIDLNKSQYIYPFSNLCDNMALFGNTCMQYGNTCMHTCLICLALSTTAPFKIDMVNYMTIYNYQVYLLQGYIYVYIYVYNQ